MIEQPKNIKRLEELIDLLKYHKKLDLVKIAEQFNVSNMTIYNDINKLKDYYNVFITKKTIYFTDQIDEKILFDYSFNERLIKNKKEKEVLSSKALNYIDDFDSFFLDGSTTCYYLAEAIALSNKKNLTIVTVSPINALKLSENKNIEIYYTGGKLITSHYTTTELGEILTKINISKAFISCGGISEKIGYTDFLKELAQYRSNLKNYCNEINMLCDSTKFNNIAPHSIGKISFAKRIITNNNINSKILKIYKKMIEII